MAFAEQTDLPLFHVDVAEVHADKLRKTHPTVQKQHDHAVIPLREIALMLGAFQQLHGLLRRQVFGQDFILLGRFDGSRRVLRKAVDLIDQIVIKPMQAGQPPGGGGLFVSAFTVQKIQIFVNVLFCYTAPECGVEPFGVDLFQFRILCHKAPAALHKAAEAAQIAVIAERCVRAFACDHFQITHILHNVRRSILERFVLAGILFIKIDGHIVSLSFPLKAVVFQSMDRIRDISRPYELHTRIIRRVQMREAVLRHDGTFKTDAFRLPQTLFQVGHTAHLAAQTDFTDGDQFVADRAVQQR